MRDGVNGIAVSGEREGREEMRTVKAISAYIHNPGSFAAS